MEFRELQKALLRGQTTEKWKPGKSFHLPLLISSSASGFSRTGGSQKRPHFAFCNRLAVKSTESLIKLAIIYAQRRSFPRAKEKETECGERRAVLFTT